MALVSAVAVALMAMALQLSAAAAAAPPPPPSPIGQPGCGTTCGNVSVPYPFGFGPSHCYWPGLNLTCDTSDSHHPPRLLLGDGSLRVTKIFLRNSTVRVVRAGSIINATGDFTTPSWSAKFGGAFTEHGYLLSSRNELVVSGCNVVAMLFADIGEKTPRIMGGCATFCTMMDDNGDGPYDMAREAYLLEPGTTGREASNYKFCSTGQMRCCQAPLTIRSLPKAAQAKWIYGGNHTAEQQLAPVNVFVAEEGWVDQTRLVGADELVEAPLLLEWKVTRDLPQHDDYTCSQEVRRKLCKSKHSDCLAIEHGYMCRCDEGYGGNPYLADGCQDVDECKLPSEESGCFGDCTNTMGSHQCRCPRKTIGNPNIKDGCVPYSTTAADALLPLAAMAKNIGQPGCSTTCGDMRVPYPFGLGPSHCYWPGFNLTCDTSQSHRPPRLLLDSNGTLEVVDISLQGYLTVIHTGTSTTTDIIDHGMVVQFQLPDGIREPYYMLSSTNEFIVFGCGVQATLDDGSTSTSTSSNTTNGVISGCVSTCDSSGLVARDGGASRAPPAAVPTTTQTYGRRHCSGRDGCCHAPITISEGRTPKRVKFKGLNQTQIITSDDDISRTFAFISEQWWSDRWYMILNRTDLSTADHSMSSPIVLGWAVKQGLSSPDAQKSSWECPQGVQSRLCKSDNSGCVKQKGGGYTCYCSIGYVGNPYIAHGCQDSCNITAVSLGIPCFGYCNLDPGHQPPFECVCPRGTHGDPYKLHGCVSSSTATGLIIGLSVASGPALLLLVLGIISIRRKLKEHRIKALKQKHFNQNRGQLLQQLVSQKADIAERMIIPVDELAKATNNFDKAREIGGGGHGTVYKGILSDLHVVAIKKSKITLQKEIDEFINEVAILSQINHKNVVKLFGCCLETEVPLLVYEFIPNGTLYHHLHIEEQKRSLSWSDRLRIATEIATSLAYLHSSVSIPIIHRDIKSSNILLDDTMTSKISDFGASRYIPIDNTGLTTRIQGTFGYLDPECFQTNRLTEKSDVYSFGVILVELLTRKKPTSSHLSNEYGGLVPHFLNLLASRNLVQIMDPQVIEEGGKEVQEVAMLAASCINLRGEERPTMRQVELALEGLQQGYNKQYKKNDMVTEEFENGGIGGNYSSGTTKGRRFEESSRRYSLEQEMMISARYPR